ncbi:MAG: glutamine synthetase family protein [Oscillospiraceae bacterium]|jgi:glutamine synthetase
MMYSYHNDMAFLDDEMERHAELKANEIHSYEEVLAFVEQEDVKFIRLAFCDQYGRQKNISIMPSQLEQAFTGGMSFDASAIDGFGNAEHNDLYLHPDPSTLKILPWRPTHGRVVRMFCNIYYPDGRRFERDGRYILQQAIAAAKERGIVCDFGAEFEFYLFKTDEEGNPTNIPFDRAGYMDIAPLDRGENVRREICFTLVDMGIQPERSHHEAGPGQQEIDFHHSNALTAADNTVTFKSVVETIAMRNGLAADFSPKPLAGESGNGMHIPVFIHSENGEDCAMQFMAGILDHIAEMTYFLNPGGAAYHRLGERNAPKYISWSTQNYAQLIRFSHEEDGRSRIELRSPDPMTNPYLAYALIIRAGLDGIERKLEPADPVNLNLAYMKEADVLKTLQTLPLSVGEAARLAAKSAFIAEVIPEPYRPLHVTDSSVL